MARDDDDDRPTGAMGIEIYEEFAASAKALQARMDEEAAMVRARNPWPFDPTASGRRMADYEWIAQRGD